MVGDDPKRKTLGQENIAVILGMSELDVWWMFNRLDWPVQFTYNEKEEREFNKGLFIQWIQARWFATCSWN